MYDKSLIETDVAEPYKLSEAEIDRILESLKCNGVAAVRGFVPPEDIVAVREAATTATTPNFSYGSASSVAVRSVATEGTVDFGQPFLVSPAATRIVTSGGLLDVVEKYLGTQPIVHHGLFQRSLPREETLLDWHIDCGSNKRLNGTKKFADQRLRMIMYLSDVKTGGLGYIVDSAADALKAFLPLPDNDMFPMERIPADEDRRVTLNQPAGTLIFFDTHGLHRPEVPKSERMVMNIWFARDDFSARLPAALFSIANEPAANRDRLYVFANERGAEPLRVPEPVPQQSLVKRLMRRLAS